METLDRCFENVCELDLIFHVDKGTVRKLVPHRTLRYVSRYIPSDATKKHPPLGVNRINIPRYTGSKMKNGKSRRLVGIFILLTPYIPIQVREKDVS